MIFRPFFSREFLHQPGLAANVGIFIFNLSSKLKVGQTFTPPGEKERTRGLFVEQSCSLMRGDRQILEQFLLPRIFRGGNKTWKSDPRDGRSIPDLRFKISPFRDLLDTPFFSIRLENVARELLPNTK